MYEFNFINFFMNEDYHILQREKETELERTKDWIQKIWVHNADHVESISFLWLQLIE